jgi:hypothetical protein
MIIGHMNLTSCFFNLVLQSLEFVVQVLSHLEALWVQVRLN